jgi:hypothetical protein
MWVRGEAAVETVSASICEICRLVQFLASSETGNPGNQTGELEIVLPENSNTFSKKNLAEYGNLFWYFWSFVRDRSRPSH